MLDGVTREDRQLIEDLLSEEQRQLVEDVKAVGGYGEALKLAPEKADRLAAVTRLLAWV